MPRSQPAPTYQPPRSTPSPRIAPTPSPTPGTRYQPAPNQPMPRVAPTPRTTTRGDSQPSPAGRYQPQPQPRGDVARPGIGGSVRGNTPTTTNRPTPGPAARGGQLTPSPAIARPRTDAASGRTPIGDGGRPRTPSPAAGNRYRPSDVVPGVARSQPAPNRGNAPTRVSAPTRGGAATRGTTPTPRLVPRTGAPSLAASPRANVRPIQSGLVGRPSRSYGYGNYGRNYGSSCYSSAWSSWWNPCGWSRPWSSRYYGYSGFYGGYYGSSWSLWGGYSSFGLGFAMWQPYWTWRNYYWNSCYSSAWWYGSVNPYCAQTSYWWYPSSTYCPTYLYVPSTVVVVEQPASSAPAVPQPTDGGSQPQVETLVAGSQVQGSVRMADVPMGATTDEMAQALATKYTELGDFYFKANRFADATESYGKARAYAPDDAQLYFVFADASFANGDYHYAAFLIGEGLRLDPAMATATTDKRTFYADAQVFDAQMNGLDAYLAKKPYDAQAHLVRGYNLRFAGNPAAATAAFQRVLEIDPDNRPAKTFLGALTEPAPAANDR